MATATYLSNAYVTVAGTDFSDQCTSVTVTVGKDNLDITSLNDAGSVSAGGLETNEVVLEMFLSYGTGEVEQILNSILGLGTTTVVVRPTSAVAGAANPQYTFTNMMLADYTPINSTVGEMATVTATFVGGTRARAIA